MPHGTSVIAQSLYFLSKYSPLDSLNNQSKERYSTEAQSSGAENTLTYDFTFDLPYVGTSEFQTQ